jgi:Xaa-Pro aminopeptidase
MAMRLPDDEHVARLSRAAEAARGAGVETLIITPSPDYAYLLGYSAPALERLTALVVPAATAELRLLVPRLEAPLARHALGSLLSVVELVVWDEVDDPIGRLVELLPAGARRMAVEDLMPARFLLPIRERLDAGAEIVLAGPMLAALRRRKSPGEIERLRSAAAGADAAMRAITTERLSGRTEAEVSRRILDLLVEGGHDRGDFAIVGSGPNSASPHNEPGSRRIVPGDAVVLDIGGTRDGYCSDTTRTAFVGEPPPAFAELYAVLQRAQQAACDAVAPGVAARDVDRAARRIIADAGYGEQFLHRTGHGIGVEGHEEPYIVESNAVPLEPGEAFSVEPGIYVEGRWGARIEDIVICTASGGERLNGTPADLYLVG